MNSSAGTSGQTPEPSGIDWVAGCKSIPLVPDFVCEARAPRLGDVPWWVWALLGTGVVAFGTMTYVSFKAAPYVLPIAIPESAPFAQAWLQARASGSSEDRTKIAQEALRAFQAQVGRPSSLPIQTRQASTRIYSSVPSAAQQIAAYEARQDRAGRDLRALMAP